MIAFLMIAGLGVLALLSRLAALTRMTIPLLYTVSMLTVFHGWYRAHIRADAPARIPARSPAPIPA